MLRKNVWILALIAVLAFAFVAIGCEVEPEIDTSAGELVFSLEKWIDDNKLTGEITGDPKDPVKKSGNPVLTVKGKTLEITDRKDEYDSISVDIVKLGLDPSKNKIIVVVEGTGTASKKFKLSEGDDSWGTIGTEVTAGADGKFTLTATLPEGFLKSGKAGQTCFRPQTADDKGDITITKFEIKKQ